MNFINKVDALSKSEENNEKLSQKTLNQIVLEFAHKIENGEAHAFDFYHNLPHRVNLKSGEETIHTKVYRAIFELEKSNPDLIGPLNELANIIGQNPQMMRPEHIIDIAASVYWDQEIHDSLKGGLMHTLGYAMRFASGDGYERAISQYLDFDNPESFTKTAHFLEMVPTLYNMGDNYSYGDNIVITRIHHALKDALDKGKGSYLLNVRAQNLLDKMDGRATVWSDEDRTPFEITDGIYAYAKRDGLYIADTDNKDYRQSILILTISIDKDKEELYNMRRRSLGLIQGVIL